MSRPKKEPEIGRGIQHCRIRLDVTKSIAWSVLGSSSKALYLDLRSRVHEYNNGDLEATLKSLKPSGWVSSATLSKSLYELLSLGFIVKTRGGGVEYGSKQCSLYGFADLRINQRPDKGIEKRGATSEYLEYRTVGDARKALADGVARLRLEALQRKGRATPKKNDASESEQVKPFDASASEQVTPSPYSKTEQGNAPEKRPVSLVPQWSSQIGGSKCQGTPSYSETEHPKYIARGVGGTVVDGLSVASDWRAGMGYEISANREVIA